MQVRGVTCVAVCCSVLQCIAVCCMCAVDASKWKHMYTDTCKSCHMYTDTIKWCCMCTVDASKWSYMYTDTSKSCHTYADAQTNKVQTRGYNMYSLLHLACHSFNLQSPSMIWFSTSLLPRSVEKRPRRLRLEIEMKWHSKCNRLYLLLHASILYIRWRVRVWVCVHVCVYSMWVCVHVCLYSTYLVGPASETIKLDTTLHIYTETCKSCHRCTDAETNEVQLRGYNRYLLLHVSILQILSWTRYGKTKLDTCIHIDV